MDSCASMNGLLQHIRSTSQTSQVASHLTHDVITNQQAGAVNNSCQYRTVICGQQPPQNTHFTLHNRTHADGQTSNCQITQQVVSSHYLVAANQPNQSNNTQTFGRYGIGGYQGYPPMNLTTQSPSNNLNNTYVQQQLVVNHRQMVNVQNSSNGQAPQGLYQNANCVSRQPPVTTATSLQREQLAYNNGLVFVAKLGEAAQNQIQRQNNTQNQFPPSISPSSYYNWNQRTHYSPTQLTKTNTLNPAVAQQQVWRGNMPPGSTYKSSTLPVYSASACSTQQFVSGARTTGQDKLSMSAADLSRNLKMLQSAIRRSRQRSGAVKSRTQSTAKTPLQQKVLQNVPCVPSAGNGSGQIQADNSVSPNSQVLELLTDSSQLKQRLEEVSSPINGTKTPEMSDVLTTIKVNDGSSHMSHGLTGTKAVAVVQPLSQESCQIACQQISNTTMDDSLSDQEKIFCSPAATENKETSLNPEYSDQMMSNTAANIQSCNDGTLSSSSDSWPRQSVQTSGLGINTAPAVQITTQSETLASQSPPEQNSVNETPGQTFQLSSLPTIDFTLAHAKLSFTQLGRLMAVNQQQSTSVTDSFDKILKVYWNNSVRTLLNKLQKSSHGAIVAEAEDYCKTHVSSDSIILRQVKKSYREDLKNFYVLKDNDVFSEPPYKSSWLNVNEQLDDIDKEFGFPQTMVFHSDVRDDESQSHQAAAAADETPVPAVGEEPTVLQQAEQEFANLSTEESSCVVDASTPPTSPESDISSDPHYSFKIQVLPPEEAKLFFGQAQSEEPQIMDIDEELETISIASVESEKTEETDATTSPKKSTVRPIEQFCCVTKWMAAILGPDPCFVSECDCKAKQNKTENTDGNSEKEEEEVQTLIIDLTEDDDRPCSSSDVDTKNSTNQSSIILQSEDGNPSCSDGEIFGQLDFSTTLSEPEDDILEPLSCTVTMESDASINRDKQTESTEHEVAIQRSDTEESCEEVKQNCADAAESPQQTQEETLVQTPLGCTQQQKRPRTEDGTQSAFRNKLKKRRLDDDAQQEKSGKTPNAHTVELSLFGSVQKGKCVSGGESKMLILSPHRERPPEVLSVTMSSIKGKSSDSVHRGEYSVKQRLHESWRRSFTPTKHSHRNMQKPKMLSDTSSSRVILKKEKLPVTSRTRVCSGKANWPSVKKQGSLFNKHGDKTKQGEGNTAHPDDKPLQENTLKFRVLSTTFNFKEGPNGQKDTTCPVSDKPAIIIEKNQSRQKSTLKAKGSWYSHERKRHPPPPVPKITITFQQFQKKYKDKIRSSADE